MRIEHKASLAIISIIVMIALGFSTFFLRYARKDGETHLKEKGMMLARGLAYNSEYGVLIKDNQVLSQLISNIMREKEVIYAIILDKKNKILVAATSPRLEVELKEIMKITQQPHQEKHSPLIIQALLKRIPIFDIGVPITIPKEKKLVKEEMLFEEIKEGRLQKAIPAEEEIGFIKLGISLEEMTRKINRIRYTVILFTALLIGLGILVAILLVRFFLKPLKKLVKATHLVAQGELDATVEIKSRDEIGDFAESFNMMVQELKQAQAKVIQSSKLAGVGQLADGIAHEINNPLTVVLGSAQLIKKYILRGTDGVHSPDLSLKITKYMEIIEDATIRCKSIVEKLLVFSKPPKGEYNLLDINGVIEDTFSLLQRQLEVNNIKVIKNLSPSLPPLWGNSNQLQQVFTNLIINAKQAMPQGGVLKIYTHLNHTSSTIDIILSDTGCGIKREYSDKIFDPFFTTKEVGEGTGLGLSVTYGIIKEHNGEIKLESQEGKGSAFIISLPVYKEPQ